MNLAKVSLLSITIALETLIVEVKDKRQKSIFEGVQHFEKKKKTVYSVSNNTLINI